MESLTDRFILWMLRSIAAAVLVGGVSMLVAGVPVAGMLAEFAVIRTITGIFFQIGIVFIVAGAAAVYLSRSRAPLFPNEREEVSGVSRTPLGSWLMGLAVALVALPAWLVIRLQSFFDAWAEVVAYLATWDIWGGDASLSGLVLLPVAAALTPPFFELIAAVWLVVTSAMLIVSLLSRSRRFPRIYISCLVLSVALVAASVRAASAAAAAGSAVEQLIQDTSANAEESAQLTDGLQRYTSVVGSAAPILVWTLFGYLIWIPPLLASRRTVTTFAASDERRTPQTAITSDLEAITSRPSFRG